MSPEFAPAKTYLYQSLIRALLLEIGSGLYAEGARFLSFRKICRIFKVGKTSVRRALNFLTKQEVLAAKPRSGYVIMSGGPDLARLLLAKVRAPELEKTRNYALVQTGRHTHRKVGRRLAVVVDVDVLESKWRWLSLHALPEEDHRSIGRMWHLVEFLRRANRKFYEVDFYFDDGSESCHQRIIEKIFVRRTAGAALFRYAADYSRRQLLHAFRLKKIPVITVLDDRECEADAAVDFNNFAAGYDGLRVLWELGHRSIGLVTGENAPARFRTRAAGATQFVRDRGCDPAAHLRKFSVGTAVEPCTALIQQLADKAERPTALFFFNSADFEHNQAAIRATGLRIPRDLAILSFGSARVLDRLYANLDLMNMDFTQVGDVAAESLDRLINQEQIAPIQLVEILHRPSRSLAPPRTSPARKGPPQGRVGSTPRKASLPACAKQ